MPQNIPTPSPTFEMVVRFVSTSQNGTIFVGYQADAGGSMRNVECEIHANGTLWRKVIMENWVLLNHSNPKPLCGVSTKEQLPELEKMIDQMEVKLIRR